MKRIHLGNGKWFNLETATIFKEGTRWDGRIRISLATESQWKHQDLYRTAKGIWVLVEYSDFEGTSDSYSAVSDDDAYVWLLKNNYSSFVEEYFADRLESNEV